MDDPLELDWEELGPLLRVGDEMARKIVIDKLWPRLCRRACLIVGERNTAEDVVQQALLYSLTGIERGDEITNWEGYFLNMVGKEARKARARNKHGKNVSLDAPEPQTEDETTSWANQIAFGEREEQTPQSILIESEYLKAVEAVVNSLEQCNRDAIRLRLWKGKTFQQIADHLGVSLNTARNYLFRGLAEVRQKLEDGLFP